MTEGSEVDSILPPGGSGARYTDGRARGGALGLENGKVEVNTPSHKFKKGCAPRTRQGKSPVLVLFI